MKVVFHPEAYDEMIESARFYEEKSAGLGSDFLLAVEETTRRIEQFANASPAERPHIRKRLVPGFPFTILHQSEGDRILVAAVMHQHRRPGYWRNRLRS